MIDRGVSYQQIGVILDRTEKAIANRAIILGRPRSRDYPLAWSDDDDATLQRLWASGATDKTASKVLGRSAAAIEARRRVLGLQRSRPAKASDTGPSEPDRPTQRKLGERDLYHDWASAMARLGLIVTHPTPALTRTRP
jgi:hypothetical protein